MDESKRKAPCELEMYSVRRRNDTAQRPLAVTVTEGGGSPPLENDLALPHLLFPVRRASRPEGYPSKESSGVSEAPRRHKYSLSHRERGGVRGTLQSGFA